MKPRPTPASARGSQAGSAALAAVKLAALRRRDEPFTELVVNSPTAFWINSVGGTALRYVNPAWERLTGRSLAAGDELRQLHEAFHPEDAQLVLQAFAEHPDGGADIECRILRPDGAVRWVRARTFPIVDASARVSRVGGLLDDITDSKEVSERSQRRKDDFVSTVSHELRTPLTSIAGSLGLLLGDAAGKLPEPALNLLRIAHSNSQRLVRLIDDILDIEKIESDKVVYCLERLEIRALVQMSVDAIRGYAQSLNVRVRLDSAAATAEVCADPDRLVQVFTNLLSNAIKFSPAGEEVLVSVEKGSNMVRVSVRDHGSGIPDDFKPHIFEKFAQAEDANGKARRKGTGLGLSIAHEIVARLGGEVSFEDAAGGGTIFHVELPYWDYLGRTRSILDGRSDGTRVLLCEDNPAVAAVLSKRLWQEGFAADIAPTLDDAARQAAKTLYAAVVIDPRVPNTDGINLVKEMRAAPHSAHTLLVVASTDPEPTATPVRLPAMLNILDWIDSPADLERLAPLLDRLIVPGMSTRPRILHVDDDRNRIRAVVQTLDRSAELVSVGSIEEARRALSTRRFDIALVNAGLAADTGLELLLELHDLDGDALPVIVFATEATKQAERLRVALAKAPAPVDSVISILRRHLVGRPMRAADHKAADHKDVA